MCGIIGIFNKNKKETINEKIIEIYQDQHNRGTNGFGAIITENNKIKKIERATTEAKFIIDLLKPENKSNMIIAHHRFPTSSENKLDQTHPFTVNNKKLKYKYLLIHNGIISNDEEMYEKHTKEGYEYTSEKIKEKYLNEKEVEITYNDSECLAIEMAQYIEGKTKEIRTRGSFAFIGAKINKKTNKVIEYFFGTNGGNPIKMEKKANNYIKLSSEGTGQNVIEDKLYRFTPEKLELKKEEMVYADMIIPGFNENNRKEIENRHYQSFDNFDSFDDYGNYNFRKEMNKNNDDEERMEVITNTEKNQEFLEEIESIVETIIDETEMYPELINEETIESYTEEIKLKVKAYMISKNKEAIAKIMEENAIKKN